MNDSSFQSTARTTVVERSTVLAASPSEVFTAVNSAQTAPLIDPAVRSWRPGTDPIAVGTRLSIRGRLGLIPIWGVNETVIWDPPRLASYRSVRPSWPFRMTADHRCEPIDEVAAGTRYTWTIRFEERHRFGRPLISLTAQLFARAMAAQAEALAAYLAAPRRPPASRRPGR